MSEVEHARPIRRIVVALDASRESQVVLEAATDLAAHLGADLVGLFIEDANLLSLAGSPFGREISRFSANLRPMQSEQLERQLRVQADQLRRALAAAALNRQVAGTLRVVRGQIIPELMRAAAESDLMILGRAESIVGAPTSLGEHGPGLFGTNAAPDAALANRDSPGAASVSRLRWIGSGATGARACCPISPPKRTWAQCGFGGGSANDCPGFTTSGGNLAASASADG